MGRPYDQYCPIAQALGVVGERWSLLVVRELQHGPLRYSDLLERIPGCSTNMLAVRLRDLERDGVLERETLPPPAPATVYALTEAGIALGPVLRELAWWGARRMGPPPAEMTFANGELARALRVAVPAELVAETIEVRVDDDVARIESGVVLDGAAADPDTILTMDLTGFYRLFVERDLGGVEVEGDPEAFEALLAGLPPAPGWTRSAPTVGAPPRPRSELPA